jgi:recombination protein RecT
MNALQIITGTIHEARDAFSSVLTDRSINFEREAGFAIQILTSNDYAMGIAQSNRQSVINAVTNVAAIGISLNPAKKQAYLVPRDGRICLDISYMGLLDLAIGSGSIRWGQAELVYEADAFALNGFDQPPKHERNPFAKDRGDVVGVYVVVKTHDGDYLTTTMTIDEVNGIRDRSSAWKAWVGKKKSCPWVTDPGEMAKKTVIKRAYKLWPKTERLDKAIHYLNTDGDEGIQFDNGTSVPAEDRIDVTPMIAAALATKTDADALRYWKENNGRLAKQPQDHDRLKKAVQDHRTKLRAAAAEDVQHRDAEPPQAGERTSPPPDSDPPPVDDEFVREMDAARS